jgi:hypothetical protein
MYIPAIAQDGGFKIVMSLNAFTAERHTDAGGKRKIKCPQILQVPELNS